MRFTRPPPVCSGHSSKRHSSWLLSPRGAFGPSTSESEPRCLCTPCALALQALETPLHCSWDTPSLVRMLVDCGADINAVDRVRFSTACQSITRPQCVVASTASAGPLQRHGKNLQAADGVCLRALALHLCSLRRYCPPRRRNADIFICFPRRCRHCRRGSGAIRRSVRLSFQTQGSCLCTQCSLRAQSCAPPPVSPSLPTSPLLSNEKPCLNPRKHNSPASRLLSPETPTPFEALVLLLLL